MATGLSWPTLRARPTRSAASGAWRVEEGELRGSTGISGPESRGGAPRRANVTTANADCQRFCERAAMRTWVGVMMVTMAAAAVTIGCSQQPGTAVVIEDKVYTVTP